MNKQEWFEKYNVWYQVNMDEFCDQSHLVEEWKQLRLAAVRAVLSYLSPLQRKIIQLFIFRNLSEREIAQKLKISKTSVHREKRKALKALGKQFLLKLVVKNA
ncbi:hypothetical protein A3H38_01135 [candidate division WOR-1 bacterium RIFCSPLOWO2_02_FULL_46_20]|nr:MAG: hypothetical protein A3H38_01135 [candidate division WOR-1 bacterium RIFCSPLOWO2_02_FULL_46_20]